MRAPGERVSFWLCVAFVCVSAVLATGLQSRRHLALAAAGPQADRLVNEGNPAEAEALLRRALRADPSSFDLRDRLADVLLAQGRRREALGERRRALARNPYTPEAYRALADTCDVLSRHGEAARVMERYLRIWPDDPRALHVYAYCCERAGRLRKALDAWQHLLRVVPGHLSAQRGVARVRTLLAREGAAADRPEAAPPRDPEQPMGAALSDPGVWM
jgi:tetratricopeptide (TPR) repeat protein